MKIPITKTVVLPKQTIMPGKILKYSIFENVKYLHVSLKETSLNDQFLIFANEGEGSDADSLSSINTEESDHELEFDDLPTYGSKFSRLATLLNPVIMNVQSLLSEANEYENHSNRGYDNQNERNPNTPSRTTQYQ